MSVSSTTVRADVRGAHLVGSINLPDAETTLRTVAAHLGDHLHRIPDGEVGERFHWILFQNEAFAATPGLSRIPIDPIELRGFDVRPFVVDDGVDPTTLDFAPLGYADAALSSYETFVRLRDEGVIAPGTRFQVSLPSAVACIGVFVVPEWRAAVEPAYEAALSRELTRILAGIPHQDLAIQWDLAVEFAIIEHVEIPGFGSYEAWFDGDIIDGLVRRVAALAEQVPADVELGFHLCYGDVAETHFTEPTDTANLTAVANALAATVRRPITWLHLPVPIERDDAAYFAPLTELALDPATEFYLGLVHRQDGVEGAERRIAAASAVVTRFGVGTECGFGRAPADTTVPLLEIHAAIAATLRGA